MGIFKSICNGIKKAYKKANTIITEDDIFEKNMNDLFESYKNNKLLEEESRKFFQKNEVFVKIELLEFGFIPFEYESESYINNKPEKIVSEYIYDKNKGLYSHYAQQIDKGIIRENFEVIKTALVNFKHVIYVSRNDYYKDKYLEVVEKFFYEMIQQKNNKG